MKCHFYGLHFHSYKPNGNFSNIGYKKISSTTSSLSSGRLKLQIAITLIMMYGVEMNKTIKILCNIKDELKARLTAAVNNLNKLTVSKACRWFESHLETVFVACSDIVK